MKTVVTGGAGFLGAQLVARLLDAPDRVGDDRASRRVVVADRATLALSPDERCTFIEIDLGEVAAPLGALVQGADAVVHLASVVSADAEIDPERAWQLNVEATRRLLGACSRSAPGSHLPQR